MRAVAASGQRAGATDEGGFFVVGVPESDFFEISIRIHLEIDKNLIWAAPISLKNQ